MRKKITQEQLAEVLLDYGSKGIASRYSKRKVLGRACLSGAAAIKRLERAEALLRKYVREKPYECVDHFDAGKKLCREIEAHLADTKDSPP